MAYDIVGGEDRRDLGEFRSVQLTGGDLRDENDCIIARLEAGAWRLDGDLSAPYAQQIIEQRRSWDIVIHNEEIE